MCWCPKQIDSMCLINSIFSTSSGRDRLDVLCSLETRPIKIQSAWIQGYVLYDLYQLDFIGRDRLDVFYPIEIDLIPGRWEEESEFRGRPGIEAI